MMMADAALQHMLYTCSANLLGRRGEDMLSRWLLPSPRGNEALRSQQQLRTASPSSGAGLVSCQELEIAIIDGGLNERKSHGSERTASSDRIRSTTVPPTLGIPQFRPLRTPDRWISGGDTRRRASALSASEIRQLFFVTVLPGRSTCKGAGRWGEGGSPGSSTCFLRCEARDYNEAFHVRAGGPGSASDTSQSQPSATEKSSGKIRRLSVGRLRSRTTATFEADASFFLLKPRSCACQLPLRVTGSFPSMGPLMLSHANRWECGATSTRQCVEKMSSRRRSATAR
ncbi:unnamed protein product [Nesidiocoris tenuis]|uniref:Uncharacterized protein n=1 Tax=Nesidiocoris tenuis TaxID=355587 RepID=A0A6H5GDS2_9HEMI|nr:unnamed protein product [Nesidiocoris tenuis]